MTLKLTLGTFLIGAAQLFATTVGVFNTGVNNGSGLDAHYLITSMPAGAGYGTDPVIITNASSIYPATAVPNQTPGYTPWLANNETSSWIGPLATPNTYGNNAPGSVAANRTVVMS